MSNDRRRLWLLATALPREALQIWAVTIGLCVLLAVVQLLFNWRVSVERKTWDAAIESQRQDDAATVARLKQVRENWRANHQGMSPTLDDARRLLESAGQPLTVNAAGDVPYTDPVTGGRARLWLRDRTDWIGVLVVPIPQLTPPRNEVATTFNLVRRLTYIWGYLLFAWLYVSLLVNWTHISAPHRLQQAVNLLVVSGCATLLACSGAQRQNWARWFASDSPAFGFAMMVASVAMIGLAFAPPRPPRDRTPKCAGCGYNLTGNVSGVCPECGRRLGSSPGTPGEAG